MNERYHPGEFDLVVADYEEEPNCTVRTCIECGALVSDATAHDRFHERLEEAQGE